MKSNRRKFIKSLLCFGSIGAGISFSNYRLFFGNDNSNNINKIENKFGNNNISEIKPLNSEINLASGNGFCDCTSCSGGCISCTGCTGCDGGCTGYCTGCTGCEHTCDASCYRGCDGHCKAGCEGCTGYCTGCGSACSSDVMVVPRR